jgi:hypothetical protein
MTIARLISPGLRSGLVILVGSLLLALPFAAGLSPAAVVTGIGVGAIGIALGIAGTDSQGRGTLPVSVQAAYDRGLAFGLLAAATLFGVAGEPLALFLFGLAGLSLLAVTVTTRYTRPL